MKDSDELPNKLSIGDLRLAPKTKPKSPDLKGTMTVQWHTLKVLLEQMEESDTGEVRCNLAGWLNGSGAKQFISVELSPLYVSKKVAAETKNLGAWLGHGD